MSSGSKTTSLPRRQLGRYLRDLRTQAGLTIAQAARLMEWGASTLQRLEKGQADRIRTIDIRELCRIYGVPDQLTEGLAGLAQQADTPSWWHAFGDVIPESFDVHVGLEAAAETVTAYHPELVPALLQTADYARALYRLAHPEESEDALDRRVQLRLQRQALITRRVAPATVRVIVHEAVLRRMVGSAKVMTGQLRHLADIGTRGNVMVRVLPFAAGVPLGVGTGAFTILEFGTDRAGRPLEPPVVHAEGLTGDLYLERPADVRRYHRAHENLQQCALDDQSSRHLLRQLAKEFLA
ncbi:helix-turn-helix domain-containing protein [Nocardia cyriacigeorgica]|uniref:helix-turn-helix domain-containing protein n=1 Tax=Nocardia cyriacigeorgica TaxID=135487 RepID=UPI001895549E|nr:helix-turn-helix transcriptional regulator [Nocardia cyriacigeorgica]MBF6286883.1 helix-turn-helix domain-containing protein [Nocardia cyriacigeorgica]MBF6425176.1 helix-turn-helix domain-containing protein [Nocardia cyriacigeorgica]